MTWGVSRDSTAILAREKAVIKTKPEKVEKKKGRPAKDTIKAPLELSRLQKQLDMNVAEMLADLPKECDFGCKHKIAKDINIVGAATSCILIRLMAIFRLARCLHLHLFMIAKLRIGIIQDYKRTDPSLDI